MSNDQEIISVADAIVGDMRAFLERKLAAAEERWKAELAAVTARAIEAEQKTLNYMAALPSGKDGRDGRDGVDAQIDYSMVENTIKGMLEEAIGGIVVPAGKDGTNGKDGKDADADAIAANVRGILSKEIADTFARLPKVHDGIDGQDGRDGRDGVQGERGRDATQIDIVKNFDDTRRYPRGTWAQFGGGLWLSSRGTDPTAGAKSYNEAGWDCMVAGVGEITARLDLETRTLSLEIESGGESKGFAFVVPMVLHRGGFEVGKEYDRGDVVQSDGSGWIADCKTKGIPGASPDWKLIAKKGRDFRPIDRNAPRDDEPIRLK
jgi:hypothetical protein